MPTPPPPVHLDGPPAGVDTGPCPRPPGSRTTRKRDGASGPCGWGLGTAKGLCNRPRDQRQGVDRPGAHPMRRGGRPPALAQRIIFRHEHAVREHGTAAFGGAAAETAGGGAQRDLGRQRIRLQRGPTTTTRLWTSPSVTHSAPPIDPAHPRRLRDSGAPPPLPKRRQLFAERETEKFQKGGDRRRGRAAANGHRRSAVRPRSITILQYLGCGGEGGGGAGI